MTLTTMHPDTAYWILTDCVYKARDCAKEALEEARQPDPKSDFIWRRETDYQHEWQRAAVFLLTWLLAEDA